MLRLLARCDSYELDLLEGSSGAAADLTDECGSIYIFIREIRGWLD
jgi:hypothetical protein